MITVREAANEDIGAILKIETESFSDPWSESAFVFAINDSSLTTAVAVDPDTDAVVGFAIWSVIAPESELCDIAISPEYRRRGAGEALMKSYIDSALSQGVTDFFLEVRQSNLPAASLYEKHGFAACGRRKNYYSHPTEDAIIMTKKV